MIPGWEPVPIGSPIESSPLPVVFEPLYSDGSSTYPYLSQRNKLVTFDCDPLLVQAGNTGMDIFAGQSQVTVPYGFTCVMKINDAYGVLLVDEFTPPVVPSVAISVEICPDTLVIIETESCPDNLTIVETESACSG